VVRPGAGGKLALNNEAQSSSRRIRYSRTARGERFCTLPGEISSMRVGEKSAEAAVARKPGNAGGAKGRRTKERS